MICVSKEDEIKTKKVQEQWLQLKMTFLVFYWVELTFVGRNKNLVWSGWMSKFLVRRGLPHPSTSSTGGIALEYTGKPCINFASRFLYTMKKLLAHHIHHVPKWSSYFCKIWVLCVSEIYMVYIVTCLFSVCNTINLSHHGRPNDGRSVSQKSISH